MTRKSKTTRKRKLLKPQRQRLISPSVWPTQAQANSFYGNPVGVDGNLSQKWYAANMVRIDVPWAAYFEHIPVTKIWIHKKCAESASRILAFTWELIGKDQAKAEELGITKFSGSHNYRPIRNSRRLSMHAYGCAWDWDAPENMMGNYKPKFGYSHPFVVAHLAEGWTWGADWDGDHDIMDSHPIDAMHFQAARVYP